MDDYESKKFIAKSENITVGELLDIWAEEELKTGTLSNGTVQNYLGAITNIKKHPISERKLKNVTSEHLQAAKITFVLSRQYYSSHSGLQYPQSNISLSIRCSILS